MRSVGTTAKRYRGQGTNIVERVKINPGLAMHTHRGCEDKSRAGVYVLYVFFFAVAQHAFAEWGLAVEVEGTAVLAS